MLKLLGRRSAYNVQKVLWTVGELGLPSTLASMSTVSHRPFST